MNQKIKTIIVEDEPLAREGLENYISQVAFLQLCASCEDAMQANNSIHTYHPDLMFLDIQMPRLTGIDFLKTLSHPPMVIFTTAYPNYALQGFELNVLDYLVKPYPFDRFLKAANKARDLFLLTRPQKDTQHPYIFVKTDHKLERVILQEILFVEAMENYVIIHTASKKTITMMTMKSLEDQLPNKEFVRAHKSYIVNREHVTAIEGNEIRVGNQKIPVSRQKKQEVISRIIPPGNL